MSLSPISLLLTSQYIKKERKSQYLIAKANYMILRIELCEQQIYIFLRGYLGPEAEIL